MSKKSLVISSIIGVAILLILFLVLSEPAQTNIESVDESTSAQQAVQTEEAIESTPVTSYASQEVARHNTSSDCWTIVDDIVYDITEYIVGHPGGEIIATICGIDGTEEFKNQGAPKELADSVRRENNVPPDTEFHSPDARSILESYELGPLESVTE